MTRYGNDYGYDRDPWSESPRWAGRGPRGGYQGRDGWYGGGSYGYGNVQGGGFQQGYGYEGWGPSGEELPMRGQQGGFGGYGAGFGHGGYDADMEFGGRGRQEGGFHSGYRSGGARPNEGGYIAGPYGSAGYGGGYETGYGEPGGFSRHGGGRSTSRAAEVMTENPEVVTPDATLAEAAAKMRELDVGIIPVVDSMDNRRLRGVITDRDIAIRAVAEGKDGSAKVSECMTSEVETVNKNDGIDRVLSVMQREQVRRVPVTDREGRVVGIIAQADLAVDYGEGRPRASRRVQETIEKISEPAHPQRSGAMRAGAGQSGRGRGSAGETENDR